MGRVFEVTPSAAAGYLYADPMPRGEGHAFVIKYLDNPELARSFAAEDSLLARLSHPGLPALVARGWDAGAQRAYSVRSFVPGTALAPGRLEAARAEVFLGIALDLVAVLEHCHRHGFVHGDIAPPNALWDPTELPYARARLIDLGAAASIAGPDAVAPGTTSGLIPYCAPERLRGEPASPLTDLWALGAVLWGLRYGAHPLPGYPVSHLTDPPRAPTTPDAFTPVLRRMLAPVAKDRYPDLAAVREALRAATASMSLDASATGHHAAERRAFPYVDRGDALADAVAALSAGVEAGRAVALDAPAEGRTRWIQEVLRATPLDRAAPILLADPGTESADAVFAALISQLAEGPDRPPENAPLPALFEPLLRSGAVLVFDDLEGRPELRAAVAKLVLLLETSPRIYSPTVILTAGLASHPRRSEPWSEADLAALLTSTYPGRRVSAHTVQPLLDVTGGSIRAITKALRELSRRGQLDVDSEWIALPDRATLEAALSRAADGRPEDLDEAARRVLALIAWSVEALPAATLNAAESLRRLEALGLIVGRAYPRPASARSRDRARALVPGDDAYKALAALLEAAGDEIGQQAYEVMCGLPGALKEAARTVAARGPGSVRLAQALASERSLASLTPLAKLDVAEVLAEAGHVNAARTLATSLVNEASDAPPEVAARIHALAGRLHFTATAYAAARVSFDAALTALGPDGPGRSPYLAELARAAVLSGAPDAASAAADACEAALQDEASPPLATELLRARVGYVRGIAGWYRGDLDAADVALALSMEAIARGLESVSGEDEERRLVGERAATRLALGLIAHRRGGHDGLATAQAHYQAALGDAERVSDMARVLGAMQNLGVVEHERGRFLAALDTYQRALTLAETLEQTARVAQIAGNLGNLHRYLGAPDDARHVLARGLKAATAGTNHHAVLLCENLLGDVALDLGELDTARAHYDAALETATRCELTSELGTIGMNRARAELSAGDAAAALPYLEAAATAASAANRTAILGQIAATMGDLGRATLAEPSDEQRARMHEGFRAATNVEAKWPIAHGLALDARDRGAWDEAERWAREVMELISGQRDAVPAERQGAFLDRPDRRRAVRDATGLLQARLSAPPSAEAGPPAADWSRIIEVAKRVASERDVDRLLAYIMDSAVFLSRAERGFLVLARSPGDGEHVDVRIARNLDQENIRQRRDKISRSIVKRVIDTAEPVLTVDAMEDERYRAQESVHDMRLRSILCVPMRSRGISLGAIYVDNRFQTAVFTDLDLRTLEALADLSAIALDTARAMSHLAAQRDQLEASRREVASLNERLAAELARREEELDASREALKAERQTFAAPESYAGIIGTSAPMVRLYGLIDKLRAADLPVLIEGESGTGKELVARAIHFGGPRHDRPFVAVNCGAIPQGLIESELFGHVKGAFTSAHQDKRGLFEVADTGTLFLDEIGELPLEMQVKLLRVLQSGEIQKVGATRQTRVTVRIVAATNRRLEEEITAQRFREDLFYRLSVVRLPLPPLRARRDDIALLVRHFIDKHRTAQGPKSIDRRALSALEQAPWPGNIRQLETVIRSALVFTEGPIITTDDLAPMESAPTTSHTPQSQDTITPMADVERHTILTALELCGGNKSSAARALGIDRRTLYNKLSAWGLDTET